MWVGLVESVSEGIAVLTEREVGSAKMAADETSDLGDGGSRESPGDVGGEAKEDGGPEPCASGAVGQAIGLSLTVNFSGSAAIASARLSWARMPVEKSLIFRSIGKRKVSIK